MDSHEQVKGRRFGPFEGFIAVIIVALITGIAFTLLRGIRDDARASIDAANAQNLYISVVSTLTIEDFTAEEINEFRRKYRSFKPVLSLLEGENPVEKSVVTRISKSFVRSDAENGVTESNIDIEGYIMLEFSGLDVVSLIYSRHADGSDAIRAPNK